MDKYLLPMDQQKIVLEKALKLHNINGFLKIHDVIYVPGLEENLLSVRKLDKEKLDIHVNIRFTGTDSNHLKHLLALKPVILTGVLICIFLK